MSRIGRARATLLALAALLTSCFSVEKPTPLDSAEFRSAIPPKRYAILPGDELEIRFFHTPELNVTLPVRPDGYISLPHIPEVLAAGSTPEELARDLESRYEEGELHNPDIAVIVRTFSAYKVHVGGRVKEPGVVPLVGPMTVIDSLFAVGGVEKQGKLSEVVVIRRTPRDGLIVIPVDIEAALNGSDVGQNIRLLPYDAVYVPNRPIADVNDWVDLYIRQNIPINFGVSLRPEFAF